MEKCEAQTTTDLLALIRKALMSEEVVYWRGNVTQHRKAVDALKELEKRYEN
jgi:hypothetical protein